ncbi:N-6 DNA methylase [Fulvivirga ulvae]|uniref:N-6 DNA methylase n=1 Tax=Fulvivirga ulvae TaxID=2904245 RepID=UPI001F1D9DF5|nr:N-6 DNA methylase [Fulvivirga ulvae]UII32268.1 N-6 DNA methylase [Fulvivirga ulvae]
MMKGDASFKLRYEASEENIDHKQFSYVTFIFRNEKGGKGRENFVVFEPSTPKARTIANSFGKKRYGDAFIESLVTPKNYQKKARVLLEEGKVITAADLTSEDAGKAEAIKKTLHNEHGVYTRESAGDNYEELIIPIPAKAKYEASIELVKREDGTYSYGLTHAKAFGSYTGESYAPSTNSPVYPDRKSALESALGNLKRLLDIERTANDASPTKDKMTGMALTAIVEFASGEGIELTDGNVEPKGTENNETEIPTAEKLKNTYVAEDFASNVRMQLLEGQQYDLLPLALLTMGRKDVRKRSLKEGWTDWSYVIRSDGFRKNLPKNLWDFVPDKLKHTAKEETVTWKPDPLDKGLARIMTPFTSTKSDLWLLMAVFFKDQGILATDLYKQFFVYSPNPPYRGAYCMTYRCNLHSLQLDDTTEKVENVEALKVHLTGPEFKGMSVPAEFLATYRVDGQSLQAFLKTLRKTRLWYEERFILIKADTIFRVDVNHMLACLTGMVRLGHNSLEIGISRDTNSMLLAPEGMLAPAIKHESSYALVECHSNQKLGHPSGRGYLYYNLETGQPETTGIAGSPEGNNDQGGGQEDQETPEPLSNSEETVPETTETTPEETAPSEIIVTPEETTSPEPKESDDDPEVVADFLEELFNQLQEGQQYHLLPFALTTMGKPEVRKVLAARNINDLGVLIASKDFRENLSNNLWQLIPDKFKSAGKVKPVDWKPDPRDKDFVKLLAKFTSRQTNHPQLMGVFFDDEGIVASDGHKMIFISQQETDYRGIYCITPSCRKGILKMAGELKEASRQEVEILRVNRPYVTYKKGIIPESYDFRAKLNVPSLRSFLRALKKTKLWYIDRVAIFKAGDLVVGFDLDLLLDTVDALLKLGHEALDIGINGGQKPNIIAPEGKLDQAAKLETDFGLVMPHTLGDLFEGKPMGKGFLYYNFETGEAETSGVAGVPCACEKTEKSQEQENVPAPNEAPELDVVEDFKPLPGEEEEPEPDALQEPGLPPSEENEPALEDIDIDPVYTGDSPALTPDFLKRLSAVADGEISFETYQKIIRVAQSRLTLDNISPSFLDSHPKMRDFLKSEGYFFYLPAEDYGWGTVDFKTVDRFKELLQFMDAEARPATGKYFENPDGFIDGWLWIGKGVRVITFRNPLKEQGYAFAVSVRGLHPWVEPVVRFIEEHGGARTQEPQPGFEQMEFTAPEPPGGRETLLSHQEMLDLVVAHMHDMYSEGKRATKGQIEKLAKQLSVPNTGMMWEAVELSWLIWYAMIYMQKVPFIVRLNQMIRFWEKIQPSYAYSDSSKELYRQYSTPCPIGAIIAQYTDMERAQSIFDPSAGNGLLLVGASPRKVHANEIDTTRLESLKFQRFKTITNYNAAEPFPSEMAKSFDVVVTNPPFSRWEDDKYNKEEIIRRYFNNQIGLARNIRLEHMMAGLALHCMKDSGKAAIIIMGHVYFDDDGFIAKYRPFFNWLYRHYYVDDVINLNSYNLYNKQGTIEKTMLILVAGRKAEPSGVAPLKSEAPSLEGMVNSFSELWERVSSHIMHPLEKVIQQLKIETGL